MLRVTHLNHRQKMKTQAAFSKLLSLLLALVLVTTAVPIQALAANDSQSTSTDTELVIDQGENASDASEVTDNETQDSGSSEVDEVDPGQTPSDESESSVSEESTEDNSESNSNEAATTPETEESGDEAGDSAVYAKDGELARVTLEGAAAQNEQSATDALLQNIDIDESTAHDAASIAMIKSLEGSSVAMRNGSELESSHDGTSIESFYTSWITEDTTSDNDDSKLSLAPNDNTDQTVRFRINYALNSTAKYGAGDIVITIPSTLFYDRSGGEIGTVRLSVPENASTTSEWNYSVQGDKIVITNTRSFNPVTQGYMEIGVEELTPSEIKDLSECANFNSTIEVVCEDDVVIGLTSNALTAQFDTRSTLSNALKRQSGDVQLAGPESIPEDQRIDGVDRYVLVTWYTYSEIATNSNQPFDLSLKDELTGNTYNGFILNNQTNLDVEESGLTATRNLNDDTLFTGRSNTTTVTAAYPYTDQFEVGHTYVFENQVAYTLTEQDSGEVQNKSATSSVSWVAWLPEFEDPEGHYYVYTYGNSNTTYGIGKETISPYTDSSTSDVITNSYAPYSGYYGDYARVLNDLSEGSDTEISYTFSGVGYILPWTYEAPSVIESGTNPLGQLENYGKKDVTLTTEYTGLTYNNESLQVGSDYSYTSVDFAVKPTVLEAKTVNLDEDGNVNFSSYDNGTVDYERDADGSTPIPEVHLQLLINGEWVDWATADWTSGSLVVTLKDGSTQTSSVVTLPEGVENIRTQITSNVAGIYYYLRVNTMLNADGMLGGIAQDSFNDSYAPVISIQQGTTLTISQDGSQIGSITTKGQDRLHGYTTDQRVEATKNCEWNLGDVDYDANNITLHYSANVDVKSYITDRDAYASAVAEGDLQQELGGTFYDLLPAGMVPDLSSIELRSGDAVQNAYTIDNYNDSGRTLLVVEADLSPNLTTYEENGQSFLQDSLQISFDAKYDLTSFIDYGEVVHNVIAYESDNDSLGSVDGYRGEADNPYGSNHHNTASAFANDEEKQALVDLDKSADNPNFVYAGVTSTLDILQAGFTGLYKQVMANNDGSWVTAWQAAPDVYEGGVYKYRLSMTGSDGGRTSNIVFYDVLEEYTPSDDDEYADESDRWQGTLENIDTSLLESKGIAPVVYYSTVEDLVIGEGEGNEVTFNENADLTNDQVWKVLDEDTDLSTVKAIAIDASKKTDGSDYSLAQGESLAVYLEMRAPGGDEAVIASENNAHAYNSVYMSSHISQLGSDYDAAQMYPYTKVGITPYSLDVEKKWNDDGDRDGLRPDSVTVKLFANGEDTGKNIVLSTENDWKGSFGSIPYADDEGNTINYSVAEEDSLEGYQANIDYDGQTITLTNSHDPEKIEINGTKHWVDETTTEDRPSFIQVSLYADGEFVRSIIVTGDSQAESWDYSFGELNKYRDGGIEIDYSVVESSSGTSSYIPTSSDENLDITNIYHPYGDLVIKKNVEDATDNVTDASFDFTLRLYTETTNDDGTTEQVPVLGEFNYTIYGSDDTEVLSGTISNDGTLSLKDDQYVRIQEIPQDVTYAVSEASRAGFSVQSSNETGTIVPNEEVTVSFTNTYATFGSVNFGARKNLIGHDLYRYQFGFTITDEDGNVLRNAANAQADVETPATDTEDMSESAPITFGELRYSNADDDKTFTYYLQETDRGRPGYTYDDTRYKVEVTPHDNGDGTMSCDVVYYDENNQVITGGNTQDSQVIFENSYKATGSFSLQGLKNLDGGQLTDGQFEFEIGKVVTSDDGSTTFEAISTATNNADGTIYFDELGLTQRDAGKTYLYAIHEIAGGDSTLDYDTHWCLVEVTVADNGNGTLSIQTNFGTSDAALSALCWECHGAGVIEGADCTACENGTISSSEDSYTFNNAYHDGNLDIEKSVTEDSEGQDATFTFRVELTNEEGEPLDTEELVNNITVEEKASGTTLSAAEIGSEVEESNPILDGFTVAKDFVVGLFTPTKAYAETLGNTVNGSEGTWHWSLDTDTGELVIGGTGVSNPGNSYNNWPWYSNRTSITSVTFEEGTTAGWNLSSMFYRCSGLTNLDLSSFNTQNVTDMNNMFGQCSNLTSLNLSGWNTSNVTNMSRMFYVCSKLTSLNLSGWNTSNVTNMSLMFYVCSSLTSLNVSSFDTSAVTSMSEMFNYCSSLTELDLSGFDTSNVTSMERMFSNCSSLTTLDLSNFNTSNVKTMNSMFYGCSSLASLNIFGWDTSSVAYMSKMFYNCDSLTSLDVSDLDTGRVTDMSSMFWSCENLTSLNLSDWNTQNVKSMSEMFYDCSSLTSLNLSSFNTENVTDMSNMFLFCSSLTSVDVSNFNTTKVTNMERMFEDCFKLTSLNLSGWNTSNVTDMSSMFYRCSGLTNLDLSSFNTQNVTDMNNMFGQCSNLTSLNLSGWNTSNVTNMSRMFYVCSKLTSLNLSGWNTSNVTNMSLMFYVCSRLSSITLGDNFSFKGKNITSTSSQAVLPTPSCPSGKWVLLDGNGNPTENTFTSAELRDEYPATGVGTYVWDTRVTINFDVNGGAGSLPDQVILYDADNTLQANNGAIYKAGSKFIGWNTKADGAGTAYADGASIPANTFSEDAEVTLYAQWQSVINVVEVEKGVIEITMPAGYVAHIPDLPAGTLYEVSEYTQEGWSLVEKTNSAGTIAPDQTLTAGFINEYTPTETNNSLIAYKELDGQMAYVDSDSGFEFSLTDTTVGSSTQGQVIETCGVTDRGVIYFSPITYTQPGTYTYEIREVAGNDQTISYDSSVIKATVEVTQGDSGLVSSTTYQKVENGVEEQSSSTPLTFSNTTKPGSLVISKAIEGATSDTALNQEFTFKVTIAGSPYSGDYTVGSLTKHTDDGTITIKGGESATLSDLKAGSTYSVAESDSAGWTQSDASNTMGTITANSTAQVSFTNTYAATGSAQIMAYKDFDKGNLNTDSFTFELFDADGDSLGTAVSGLPETNETTTDGILEVPNTHFGQAPVYFPEITYDEPGEYVYTIKEVIPDNPSQGVVYDDGEFTAKVVVSDTGTGTLESSVTYYEGEKALSDVPVFINSLEDYTLTLSKVVEDFDSLSAAAQANANFSFTATLKDASGESLNDVSYTVYNQGGSQVRTDRVTDGGTIELGANEYAVLEQIPYGSTYEFVESNTPGWNLVSDKSSDTFGTVSQDTTVVVTNEYEATGSATLSAKKSFDGTLEAGQFQFVVVDNNADSSSYGSVIRQASNEADGSVTFDPFEYSNADAGKTFSYQIRELNTYEENVSYDEHVVAVEVSVVDNGDGTLTTNITYDGSLDPYTFENLVSMVLAKTGGFGGLGAAGITLVAAGLLTRYAFLRRRRGMEG